MHVLGLPWWWWIPLNLVSVVASGGWRVYGSVARAEHRLTCRAFFQVYLILDVALTVSAVVCWYLWFGRWALYFVAGLGTVVEGTQALWVLATRRLLPPVDRRPCETRRGQVMVPVAGTVVESACEAWRHRTHDDDCEHGPTKRWAGSAARLLGWRKVALNPAFRPS